MERLSPLDVSFLHLEDDVNHMHVGWTAVFAGPEPDWEDLLAHIDARLDYAPRYRQRIRNLPFGLARPLWEDDQHFKLDYHVRHSALPPPGGIDELRALVGRLMAQPLDRSRPLWELWVIDGIDSEHWAIVGKVHHAVASTMAGAELFATILDAETGDDGSEGDAVADDETGPASHWSPEQARSDLDLLRDLAEETLRPEKAVELAKGAARLPVAAAGTAISTVKGLTSLAGLVRPRPGGAISGPIGPHRRYGWVQIPFDDVRAIKDAFGTSVNDVVLAAVAYGFRDLLLGRSRAVTGRTVRAMVPVSVREEGTRGYRNRVSSVIVELPIGADDPLAILRSIHTQLLDATDTTPAVAARTLTSLAGFAPPMLLSLGMRTAATMVRHVEPFAVDTVVTNVPGPSESRHLLGRELLHTFPYAPLAEPIRIAVAVFSYAGELSFGVTADWDAVTDIEDFLAGVEGGLLELQYRAEHLDDEDVDDEADGDDESADA